MTAAHPSLTHIDQTWLQTGKLRGAALAPTLSHIYRTEGVAGLFRGNGASVLRIVPYASVRHAGLLLLCWCDRGTPAAAARLLLCICCQRCCLDAAFLGLGLVLTPLVFVYICVFCRFTTGLMSTTGGCWWGLWGSR